MKTLILITALCFVTDSSAQFWKKIGDKAEKAVERVLERKVEEKAEKETEIVFDSVFNNQNDKKLFKNKKAKVAEYYTFTHQYTMEVISKKDTTLFTYYLTNNHEYMGSSFKIGKNEEFITIMDLPNSAIHTFMDLGNKKSMSSFKVDLNDETDTEMNTNNFTISATGQKKQILGYQCEEFQVTGPKLSGTVWVTQEANISFQKAFNQLKTKRQKGINQSWVSMVDGLALEMTMTDYTKRKPTTTKMICTSLSENNFSIETSQYRQ